MGKQRFQKLYILPNQTARLAIPELTVIKDNAPAALYEVVHQGYFSPLQAGHTAVVDQLEEQYRTWLGQSHLYHL